MDIQPGSKVTVTVTKNIRARAARLTLARIFRMDPGEPKRRPDVKKNVTPTRRGGRIWNLTKKGSVLRVPEIGESCHLTCTLDVIRDLGSVDRFIDVSTE